MNFSEFLKNLAQYCRTGEETTSDFTYAVLESAVADESDVPFPKKSSFVKVFSGERQLSGKIARMMLAAETLNKDGFIDFLRERISMDVDEQMRESFGFERDLDIETFYEEVFEIFVKHLKDVVNRENADKIKTPLILDDVSIINNPTHVVTESRPLQPSNFFRGRERQLTVIKESLSGVGKLMLLNGMGGIGKTEMCRKLFHEALNGRLPEVQRVGWLTYNGSLEQTFFRQFSTIANPASKSSEYMKQAEAYINTQGNELLLFVDNANEMTEKEAAKLLKLNCKVLMTSRRRNMERLQALEIGKLEMDDCRILYRQHLNMMSFDKDSDSNYNTTYEEDASPDENLDAIIIMADRHTLAIELLAKQQRASMQSMKRFRKTLEDKGFSIQMAKEKIGYLHNPESEKNIDWDKTEQAFIEQFSIVLDISGIKGDRKRIMSLLSLLAAEPVDAENIKDWLGLDDYDIMSSLVSRGWVASGMIGIGSDETPGLAMHPLVSSVVRHKAMPDEDMAQVVIAGVTKSLELPDEEIFASRLPFVKHAISIIETLVGSSGEYANLINHTSYILLRSSEYKKTEQILKKAVELLSDDMPLAGSAHNNLGHAYELRGEYALAEEEYEKALEIFTTTLGYYSRDTSSAYNNIAGIHVIWGRFEEALKLYEKTLEIRKKVLGDDHPVTQLTYNNIAVVYGRQGHYDKSLELLQHNIEVFEYGLEYDHNYIALALGNLAEILKVKGDYAKALETQQRVVAIYENVFGINNPDTAGGYSNLAGLYSEVGNYIKALEYYEKARYIFVESFGDNHYSTSLIYDSLGQLYDLMGNYTQALEMTQAALAIVHDIFGEGHMNAAGKYSQLAVIYSHLGDYANAKEYGFKALKIEKDAHGEIHFNTAVSYNNLSNTFNRLGEYKKAITAANKALEILNKAVGARHTGTAISFNNLANAYMHLAEYDKAKKYYHEALDINLETVGEEHPNTATAYDAVANMYSRFADYEKGLKYFNHALRIKKMFLGDSHPKTATTYSNIAGVYEKLGNHDKAYELYTKVLEIRKETLGEKHLDTAFTLNNVANIYSSKGKHNIALEIYMRVLAIREDIFDEKHQTIAASCNNIAYTHDLLGDKNIAIEWYERALEIKTHTIGEGHPSTAISYLNISALYFDIGDNAEAEMYCRKALAIREDKLGKKHPETASTYHNLACIIFKREEYLESLRFFLKAYIVRLEGQCNDHSDTIDTFNCIKIIYDRTMPHDLPFDLWLVKKLELMSE